MVDRRAQRTLVKSPPELWAEVSDGEALGRHLEPFGEIRITRLEPETTVAWEGDRACGTVELEAAGWGTRVTLTARTADDARSEEAAEAVPAPAAAPAVPEIADAAVEELAAIEAPAPVEAPTTEIDALAEPEPEPAGPERRGWWRSLFGRRGAAQGAPAAEPPPEPAVAEPAAAEPVEPSPAPLAEPDPPPPAPAGPPAPPALDAEGVLTAVLDDLGAAHHRPFSR
jgi:hypothetical protein